jgi:hypothetical protein
MVLSEESLAKRGFLSSPDSDDIFADDIPQ